MDQTAAAMVETFNAKVGNIFLHRRQTEEKAKVVAAVLRTELIQFLATLPIFHQDDFEEKDE